MSIFLYYFIFSNLLLLYTDCEDVGSTPKYNPKFSSQPTGDIKRSKNLITEGGAVDAEGFNLNTKDNQTSLLNLDQGITKNKVKPIVPRKGVILSEIETNSEISNLTSHDINTTVPSTEPKPRMHTIVYHNQKVLNNINNVSATDIPTHSSQSKNNSMKHKKPSILSSEVLSGMEATRPNDDETESIHNVMSNKLAINSHPGLIMPVVITILVVPLFVVVGYMALQRGREAWKNRHYKRMDFLLDGMYNE